MSVDSPPDLWEEPVMDDDDPWDLFQQTPPRTTWHRLPPIYVSSIDKFIVAHRVAEIDGYYLITRVMFHFCDGLNIVKNDDRLWMPIMMFSRVNKLFFEAVSPFFEQLVHVRMSFRQNDILTVLTNFGQLLEPVEGDNPDTLIRKHVVLCATLCVQGSKWPEKDKEAVLAFQEPEKSIPNCIGIWLKINGYASGPKAPIFYHLLQEFLANFVMWRSMITFKTYELTNDPELNDILTKKKTIPSNYFKRYHKHSKFLFNMYNSLIDFLYNKPLAGSPRIEYGAKISIANLDLLPRPEVVRHLAEELEEFPIGQPSYQLISVRSTDGYEMLTQDDGTPEVSIETWSPTNPLTVQAIINWCPEVYEPLLGPRKEEIMKRIPPPLNSGWGGVGSFIVDSFQSGRKQIRTRWISMIGEPPKLKK